jgi:hypothetical protein
MPAKKKEKNEIKISKNGEFESHNMGKNCMSCHVSGGNGEGWFKVAGTVYDSLFNQTIANGKVELYTQANAQGDKVLTIEIDGNGNFYSTENIDFKQGLYPVVTSQSGKKKFMASSISQGACNSCHNVSQSKIWVNK